jgi:hypothetical protein
MARRYSAKLKFQGVTGILSGGRSAAQVPNGMLDAFEIRRNSRGAEL